MLCLPAPSKPLCSLTKRQKMRCGPVPVSNSIWHDTYVMRQSGSSLSILPPLCPWVAGWAAQLRVFKQSVPTQLMHYARKLWWNLRRKKQSKQQIYWCTVHLFKLFSSFKCFAPLWEILFQVYTLEFEKTNEFKCFKGRHKTRLGCNSSLPAGTANTTKPPHHRGHPVSAETSLWEEQGLKIKHSL